MSVETILAFGYKGNLLFVETPDTIAANDEIIKTNGTQYPLMTHHAEISFFQEPIALPSSSLDLNYRLLTSELKKFYHGYGKYGDFGDVMFVLKANGFYYLTAIGRKAYRLPAFAADILPIVVDTSGQKFFLGIIRGDNSHRATVGGFMDVRDCELESAVECLVHESFEEIGLKLNLKQSPNYHISTSPFPDSEKVGFELLGEKGDATMTRLGIFYSPPSNLRPEFGTKRVHVAAGYILPICLNQTVTAEQLRNALVPQDKMENNQTFVWDMNDPDIGLGSGHQHMYNLAKGFLEAK